MRFGDGTLWQKTRFAALLLVYILGLAIALDDKLERLGQPDVGWLLDDGYMSPTRRDSSQAGLRGGGRALYVNGIPVDRRVRGAGRESALRTRPGETNALTFMRPTGEIDEITVPVRSFGWHDVVFTEGATDLIGFLFVVVGVATFMLRPYEPDSWALIALCALAGSALTTEFIPFGSNAVWIVVYREILYGFVSVVAFHVALAFPVVHPLLRRRWVLAVIYSIAILKTALGLTDWYTGRIAIPNYSGATGTMLFVAGVAVAITRSLWLAIRSDDPLVKQRARIAFAGMLFGLVPVAVLEAARETFHIVTFDSRFAYWALGIFLIALARITLRPELMNARIAVRRAFIYTLAVAILTGVVILLSAVTPYAVAVLLFPLLYFWPRFETRLDRMLYPKRTRFPELIREIGGEMESAGSVEELLDRLVEAPARLCDAATCADFLLPRTAADEEVVHTYGNRPVGSGGRLADEPLVQLLRATRKEVLRDHVAVQPQYENVREECLAGFDRLSAELVLPIVRDGQVVGGLAIGPRTTGDVYEAADLDALCTVVQQFVQAMSRIDATERLRDREVEFAELKRFFPPQIIDQVMARGGVAEMRSQRKIVTVVFVDLRGFTSFSDSVEPEEVMATLAQYHAAMGRRIAELSGTVERFAGDGIMVFFNDPVEQSDHAMRAAKMSLAMREDVRRLREDWVGKGYEIDVGIGIHTGYATCGFIGYEGRRDYGVIGNVTNLAARLSDAAGPGEILISARVRSELQNGLRAEPAGELMLKGFHQPQRALRLLD